MPRGWLPHRFLDFSLAVGPAPEFDGWDSEESSWPILIDEYVEFVQEKLKET